MGFTSLQPNIVSLEANCKHIHTKTYLETNTFLILLTQANLLQTRVYALTNRTLGRKIYFREPGRERPPPVEKKLATGVWRPRRDFWYVFTEWLGYGVRRT